jgi:hypothetical protein
MLKSLLAVHVEATTPLTYRLTVLPVAWGTFTVICGVELVPADGEVVKVPAVVTTWVIRGGDGMAAAGDTPMTVMVSNAATTVVRKSLSERNVDFPPAFERG